jgi:hypothetical protein
MKQPISSARACALIALAFTNIRCGPAETVPDSNIVSQRIEGGTLDPGHDFAVAILRLSGGDSSVCSGVIIAPNLVATARHCVATLLPIDRVQCGVSAFAETAPAAEVFVALGPALASSELRTVVSIAVPQDSHFCGNDIALLTTENALPTFYAQPALSPPITDHREYGEEIVAIGYGIDPASASSEPTGVARRIKENIPVMCIPNDPDFVDCFDFSGGSRLLAAAEFVAGDGTCKGDSGSGAFEQRHFDRQEWVTFGVLSRGGLSPDGMSCVGSVYTRFDSFSAWIVDVAVSAASVGGYEPPRWIGSPPSVKVGSPKPEGSEENQDASSCTACGASACSAALPGTRSRQLGRPAAILLAATVVLLARRTANGRRRKPRGRNTTPDNERLVRGTSSPVSPRRNELPPACSCSHGSTTVAKSSGGSLDPFCQRR